MRNCPPPIGMTACSQKAGIVNHNEREREGEQGLMLASFSNVCPKAKRAHELV